MNDSIIDNIKNKQNDQMWQGLNAWNLTYKLLDNVKSAMDNTKIKNRFNIGTIHNIIDYLQTSLNDIKNNTITQNDILINKNESC